MSDVRPSPADSDTGCNPTAIGPPNSTETAPPPDPAETYPPRTVETAPPHPAEASLASPAAGNTGAETTRRSSNSRQFTRIWRRARVRVLAVIGAAIVGIAFGHVVAGNDYRIQIFLSTTVSLRCEPPFAARRDEGRFCFYGGDEKCPQVQLWAQV